MRDIDVLFLYEHADRELDVACAVKSIAQSKYGLSVEIIQHPIGQLSPELPLTDINPHIVLIPHAYHSGMYSPYVLDWPKATFINLMWEQLLYQGNSTSKRPLGKFSLEHVLHVVWGDFAVDYLHGFGVPKKNIFVNGNLAYKLYDEPYRRFYSPRAELAQQFNLDINKRWVFFPENYGWAFYTAEVLQDFIANGQKPEDVYAMHKFCMDSLSNTFYWCTALAKRGDIEVVIRPRPYTSLEKFTKVVHDVIKEDLPSNFHILKDRTVREWILASDIVVSSYSTSLIEASVAKKPSYMLEPLPIPSSLYMEWHEHTPRIKTEEEFITRCTDTEKTPSIELNEWARKVMMSRGDAIENLADLLKKIKGGEVQVPTNIKPLDVLTPQGTPIRDRVNFNYQRFKRKYQHLSVKVRKKKVSVAPVFEKDLISQKEINQRVEKWRKTLTPKPEMIR